MKTTLLIASVWAHLCLANNPITPDKVEADIKTNEYVFPPSLLFGQELTDRQASAQPLEPEQDCPGQWR
jgi:hypothetical protein